MFPAGPGITGSIGFARWTRVATVVALVAALLAIAPGRASALAASAEFVASTSDAGESGAIDVAISLDTGGDAIGAPITVDVVIDGGTATNGEDFEIVDASATFPAGSIDAEQTVAVTILGDSDHEFAETIELSLQISDPGVDNPAIGAQDAHVITIADDDPTSIAFVSATSQTSEATSHSVDLVLTVPGGGTLAEEVIISVADLGGSADTPDDYVLDTSLVTFAVGSADGAVETVDLTIAGDPFVEPAETVNLEVSPQSGPAIAADSHEVTIVDINVPGITLAPTSIQVTEGAPATTYDVVLDTLPGDDVIITPNEVDGIVSVTPPSLTFTPDNWDTPQSFSVVVANNNLADGTRVDSIAHQATSDDPDYDIASAGSVAVDVIDDEGPATVSINDVSDDETDGTVVYIFTLSITPPAAGETTVEISTIQAITNPAEPSEFESITDREVTIPAGAATHDIAVETYGDNLAEPNERFRVVLTNPGGGLTLGDDIGRGTIQDDDAVPRAVKDDYEVAEAGSLTTTPGTGVLANDSDDDDISLTAILTAAPSRHVGDFVLNLDGTFTYDHDGTGTSDTFKYVASDGANQSAERTVTITYANVAPTVDAGSDPAPTPENSPVVVSASFTDPGLADTHTATIDWGDGVVDDCTVVADCTLDQGAKIVTGNHTYPDAGVYTVTVTVTDSDGGVGSDTLTVTITGGQITVTPGSDRAIDEGDTVNLVAGFADGDGKGNHKATIDWGDGSPLEDCPGACTINANGDGTGTVIASHTYADNGVAPFTVVVTVFDGSGDTGSGGFTVTVANVAPIAGINGPSDAAEGDIVRVAGTRSDPGADGVSWSWEVTRDGQFFRSATTRVLKLKLRDQGVYEYTLIAMDNDGAASDPVVHTVIVANVDPIVEITDLDLEPLPSSSVHGTEGKPVRLQSTVVDPGADPQTFSWAIRLAGELIASSDTRRISFVPEENGTYFVSLSVDDGDGGTDTDSVLIIVENGLPVIRRINFDATPAVGATVGLDVFFTDPGALDTHITTVTWGDGGEDGSAGSSPRSLSHKYQSRGTVTATVCVKDDDGGEACRSFYVNPGVTFEARSDFNGDGFEDLPIGVPGEDQGAGAVSVIYGRARGLTAVGDDIWKQGVDGVNGAKESGDAFGASLAWGDFNLDGYSDLAIGAPGEDVGAVANAGAVHILYGSAGGLSGTDDASFNQDSFAIAGANNAGDRFGASLAVGDFNGDGFADLAIGVPGEDVGGKADAGRIGILFGSPDGLTNLGNVAISHETPGVFGQAALKDAFGAALASGDFDRDGSWDLAVGIPGKSVSGNVAAGVVLAIEGSILGMNFKNEKLWHQDKGTMANTAAAGDRFGSVLETGDFNGDNAADLAVGIPKERVAGKAGAGAVAVLLGGPAGLSDTGNQIWHEDRPGVSGIAAAGDRFGFALAAGDFDKDGRDDLAIGIPYQEVGGKINPGAVAILRGAAGGLTAAGDQRWTEETPKILGRSQRNDHFGWALRALDADGDGDSDLAVGIPDQNRPGHRNAGAVLFLKGRSGGITALGDSMWHQDKPGIREAAGPNDRFGRSL